MVFQVPGAAGIPNDEMFCLTAGRTLPAPQRARAAQQGRWPSPTLGGDCEKFGGPKGAEVTLSEESMGFLWPGYTAWQLKEGRSLLLPADLEHP